MMRCSFRFFTAMSAIWLLGVISLWIVSNVSSEDRRSASSNTTTVYDIDPGVLMHTQDISARFTVIERVGFRREISLSTVSES